MRLLEGGLVDRWKQGYWPADDPCGRAGIKTRGITLSLADTSGAFVVLGIGITAALLTLACEFYPKSHPVKPIEE